MDDEVKGEGLQYDYGFRIYDPRLGRFLSMDPLFSGYPYYTPYQFAGNRPIWAVDLDGLEELTRTKVNVFKINVYGTYYDEFEDPKTGEYHKAYKEVIQEGDPGAETEITTYDYHYAGDSQYRLHKSFKVTPGKPLPTPSVEVPATDPNDNNKLITSPIIVNVEKPAIQTTKQLDVIKKVNQPSVKKTVPKPNVAIKQPNNVITSSTTTRIDKVKLSVDFENDRKNFADPQEAAKILGPILNKLKANPNNTITLSPNTYYKKNKDILDMGGLMADGDTSNELVKLRGQTLIKWFTSRGVNPNQIKIDTSNSYDKQPNVTGTLTTTTTTKNN